MCIRTRTQCYATRKNICIYTYSRCCNRTVASQFLIHYSTVLLWHCYGVFIIYTYIYVFFPYKTVLLYVCIHVYINTHIYAHICLRFLIHSARMATATKLILFSFITGNSSLEPFLEGLFAQIHIDLSCVLSPHSFVQDCFHKTDQMALCIRYIIYIHAEFHRIYHMVQCPLLHDHGIPVTKVPSSAREPTSVRVFS